MQKKFSKFKYKFYKVFRSHQTFVVLVVVLLLLTAVVIRINSLGNIPTDQVYLDKKLGETKSVNFNRDAIEQIKLLNESNVSTPGTQLPTNRQNPFNE